MATGDGEPDAAVVGNRPLDAAVGTVADEGDDTGEDGDDSVLEGLDTDTADSDSGVQADTFALRHWVNRQEEQASNHERRRAEAEQDRVLIHAVQQGDTNAFELLVQRHQRGAYAVALGYVRDRNDAKEITQEAFLRAYRGLSKFQGSSSFYTWLYRIVTNLCIDFLRRSNVRHVELDEQKQGRVVLDNKLYSLVSASDAGDPLRVLRRKEIAMRLEQALAALPPYHLGVILMREVDGMSYSEMAEAMGVSKGTIMSRLFHARQKLQAALRDCYELEYGAMPSRDARPGDDYGKDSSEEPAAGSHDANATDKEAL